MYNKTLDFYFPHLMDLTDTQNRTPKQETIFFLSTHRIFSSIFRKFQNNLSKFKYI